MVHPPTEQLNPNRLNLLHLQAELGRIDVLLARQVRRWQRAGQDPLDAFRGLYVSDQEAEHLLKRPLAAHWGETVEDHPDEERIFSNAMAQADQQVHRVEELAESMGETLRLNHLAAAFGLDRFDVNTLLICLAVTLDLRYERVYGYLQDDVTRKRPTVNLVLNLLAASGTERLEHLAHFEENAPLFRFQLLEFQGDSGQTKSSLQSRALYLDDTILAWLMGRYQPNEAMGLHANLIWCKEEVAGALLPPEVQPLVESELSGQICVAFWGPDGMAQRAAAEQLASRAQRPLLTIDVSGVAGEEGSGIRMARIALRDARLTHAIPFFTGWDACLDKGHVPTSLLLELFAFPDPVLIGSQSAWRPEGVERTTPFVAVEFGVPSFQRRQELWKHFLGETYADSQLDLAALSGQFQLTAGQIRDAVATAWDQAAQRGQSIELPDLYAAARLHSNAHLIGLARKIAPRYAWQDIVLPPDQLELLHEIIATVRTRAQVLVEWGVGEKLVSSSGVTVLFAGPPGTGKTMAAEVIAGELGLDLYKVDLSTIVSKYIGETEKNLERIFSEAESSNAILFFDEADALFGKRSEVRDSHDRYANIEISYLLQRMEAYEGVTILATNLRSNLDEAFTRRLQFAVDFPFPDETDRLRIWQALFPPEVPREELDLALMAHRYKLAGGNIRNILVSAAYLAAADGGRVTMSHLLHSTRRELQKMGRLVGDE